MKKGLPMDRPDSMRVFLRVAETATSPGPRTPDHAAGDGLGGGQQLKPTRQPAVASHHPAGQLTHDGSVVLERCRHLLEDMEELESLFRDGSRAGAPAQGRRAEPNSARC